MNNELQIFTNEQFGDIRTVEENGKVLLCGNDIANALGYSNPRDALNRHCKGVVKRDTPTEGGTQAISFIPEGDVYRLIAHSKLPKAQEFESWVFDEVLPTIRKHGAYMTEQTLEDALTSPDFLIRLATQLKEEQEARKALEAENAAMQPKALFADAVATADTSILVGEMAKILTQNGVKDMGQNRFFTWLRDNGYLMKTGSSKNMPTQMASEKGLIEIKESTKVDPNGTVRVMKTPKITGAGQQYFVNLFLNKASDNATA
jgi:anti-repressor protein